MDDFLCPCGAWVISSWDHSGGRGFFLKSPGGISSWNHPEGPRWFLPEISHRQHSHNPTKISSDVSHSLFCIQNIKRVKISRTDHPCVFFPAAYVQCNKCCEHRRAASLFLVVRVGPGHVIYAFISRFFSRDFLRDGWMIFYAHVRPGWFLPEGNFTIKWGGVQSYLLSMFP